MAKQPITPQPTEVFLPSDEAEESPDLVLESPSGSGKGKRTTEGYKLEILDWIDDYNRDHGRGGQSEAAKKFKVSMLTLGNWRKKLRPRDGEEATPRKARSSSSPASSSVNMESVYKVLGGKGFKFQMISTFGPEGITSEFVGDKKLEKLNLVPLEGSLNSISDGSSFVISTDNKVIVAMTLDQLLQLTGIKA